MKKLLIAVSLLPLTACLGGPSATQSVTKGQEQSGGLFGLVTKDEISVDSAGAFKDVEEVVIGGFTVSFDITKNDSSKAGGGLLGGGFGGKSSATSKLVGVDDAALQKITDKAYASFVADLKANGYKVADRAKLLEHEAFKDTTALSNPYEDTSGGIFSDALIVRSFAPSGFGGIKPFGGFGGLSAGIGFGNPLSGAAKYAEETKSKVIYANYRVDFANAEKYGGWSTKSSSVQVGQGVTVSPEASQIGIIGGWGGSFSSNVGTIKLGQPISSEKAFAEVKNTNSEAYKAAEVAVNIIGTLGGVGSNSSREYEFIADPAKYSEAADDALSQANKKLTDKMKSLK